MEVVIYADGGSQNNGSAHAYGYGSFCVVVEGKAEPIQTRIFETGDTNNMCEYKTLLAALNFIQEQNWSGVTIKMDSALVVNQVAGSWKVREAHLVRLRDRAREGMSATQSRLEWVRREEIVPVLGH